MFTYYLCLAENPVRDSDGKPIQAYDIEGFVRECCAIVKIGNSRVEDEYAKCDFERALEDPRIKPFFDEEVSITVRILEEDEIIAAGIIPCAV